MTLTKTLRRRPPPGVTKTRWPFGRRLIVHYGRNGMQWMVDGWYVKLRAGGRFSPFVRTPLITFSWHPQGKVFYVRLGRLWLQAKPSGGRYA